MNQRTLVEEIVTPGLSEWDFCSGDFNLIPSVSFELNLPNALGRPGIEFAKDGDLWYGFVTGTWASVLYRLEYANGIDNPPTSVTNLGNLGGSLIGPGQLRIFKDGSNWFGILHNAGSSGGELLKLSFGPRLSNPITATVLAPGFTNLNSGVAVGRDENAGWVCVLTSTANQFILIRLGPELLPPASADIINSTAVPDQNNLGDVDLMKDCDGWFGFATNLGNGNLYRLRFGANLFTSPSIEQIAGTSLVNGGRLRVVREGSEFFLLGTSLGGELFKTSFGTSLSNPNPVITNLGNFGGVLQNSYGLGMAKENSIWNVSVIDQGTGRVSRLNFSPDCPVVVETRNQSELIVYYTRPGTYTVTLKKAISSNTVSVSKNVFVSNEVAPDIGFDNEGVCSQHSVLFSPRGNGPTIVGYSWDFGDGATSSLRNPSHTFTDVGSFLIRLSVQSTNGCGNLAQKAIRIFPAPLAKFNSPAGVICTNNQLVFINDTRDNFEGNLGFQWFVNKVVQSATRDFTHLFRTTGDQEVMLRASIPGCSSEFVRTIPNVGEGPTVGFQVSGNCVGEPISFTNQSTGNIAGYEWDFGETASTEVSPTVMFAGPGSINAKLKAIGTNGCVSETMRPHTIFSTPNPDFSLALPPFSCAGSPSQFTDLTPPPTDSNITSWAWTFATNPPATSGQRNPAFTFAAAGDYRVSLAVTTDMGCAGEVHKTVAILPAPTIEFDHGPACRNQPTRFNSSSSLPVRSYQWTIGASTYTVANPTHVFQAAGSSQVLLRVVANNLCVATAAKTVAVPAELAPEFSVANACAGQPAVFTNATAAAHDPVRQTDWLVGGAALQGDAVQTILPAAGTYPVRIQVTALSGCTYSQVRNVAIHPTPLAGFDASDEAGPAPFRVTFSNTSVGATAFLWRFNDGQGSTSTAVNPAFTFEQLGSFSVELLASNAFQCASRLTRELRVVVPVPDLELQDFQIVRDPLSNLFVSQAAIRNNSNYTIREVPVSLNLGLGVAFRESVSDVWRPGTTRTVTLQTRLQTLGPPHFACAELLLANDVAPLNNRRCIALNDTDVWLAPYPNPASQTLTVPVITATATELELQLVNTTGAVVYRHHMVTGSGLAEWSLPVGHLPAGIYLLVLRSAAGERTFRVHILR